MLELESLSFFMHKSNKNQLGPRLPGPDMLGTKVTRPRLRRTEITSYRQVVLCGEWRGICVLGCGIYGDKSGSLQKSYHMIFLHR